MLVSKMRGPMNMPLIHTTRVYSSLMCTCFFFVIRLGDPMRILACTYGSCLSQCLVSVVDVIYSLQVACRVYVVFA
jgi:hypothetical protein